MVGRQANTGKTIDDMDKSRHFEKRFLTSLVILVGLAVIMFGWVVVKREIAVEESANTFVREFGVVTPEKFRSNFVPEVTDDPDWNTHYSDAQLCIEGLGEPNNLGDARFSHSTGEATSVFFVLADYERGNARFELEYVSNNSAYLLQSAKFTVRCVDAESDLDMVFGSSRPD